MSALPILDLPQEILSNIVSFLPPRDIVSLGRTCQRALAFISPSNQILWRTAFLQVFDDPEEAWSKFPPSYNPPRADWDWHRVLELRFLALAALYRRWPRDDDAELAEQHRNALLDIIDTAKSAPSKAELAEGKVPHVDDRSSLSLQLFAEIPQKYHGLDRLIFEVERKDGPPSPGQFDYDWYPGRPVTRSMSLAAREENRPESACRLHALYGLTMRERIDHRSRGMARRKVYNWSLTNESTDYGPFALDGSGRVNWSLLEGACSAISRNFELCVDGRIALPHGMAYSIPHRTIVDPTIPHDWARAQGTWLGTYAFIDYADLLAFNTGTNLGFERRPDLTDEPEACGALMRLETKLDNSVKDDRGLKTKVPMCTDLPPLYFSGHSRGHGYTHPVTAVKGFAALVPGGREVRWKFIVAYNGVDQWQLEGIQPGGVRSGGVYGVWSQVDHEPHGPIGPFCYFPMELCKPTSIVLAS
jgi:F-box-like